MFHFLLEAAARARAQRQIGNNRNSRLPEPFLHSLIRFVGRRLFVAFEVKF